jgi:holo-[acyl-carrier protein] synthase
LILGIGLDIIETARVEKALQNPVFLKKVYTEGEQEYLAKRKGNAQSAAGIFAAKEAVSKALGTGFGPISFQEVEIVWDENGKPSVRLTGRALMKLQEMGGKQVLVSITHIKDLAAAQAVIDGGGR